MEYLFGKILLVVSIPFVFTTIYFANKKSGYYDSDEYDGNGTAH